MVCVSTCSEMLRDLARVTAEHQLILQNIRDTIPISKEDMRGVLPLLYTRGNPVEAEPLHPNKQWNSTHFKRGKPIKIIIHGFGASGKDVFAVQTKNAFLRHDDMNVIILDWAGLARGTLLAYPLVMRRSKYVASEIARLIVRMSEELETGPEKVHMIGLSLGSNIASLASRMVMETTPGRHPVKRITGLDPTLLFNFDCDDCIGGMKKEDAEFIDVIHTNIWAIGLSDPVGHVDFFPNGGLVQPGCTDEHGLWNVYELLHCPHVRAWLYYLESINHPYDFMGRPCSSWEVYESGNCSQSTPLVPMGYHTPHRARGEFYLKTNAKPPFGKRLEYP
ncbi:unnamed protein product [Darwinula stevensoni]|uniref:Lipase domain-containing protein n=1 Tax=Darwinula stevensoni TaxID=69355 RepID=A0A7R8WYJ9_9CRUS|nr:unnamed protein product [Darwinula stevensoni]CAG0879030.1 unnamed protein product [Darwinula stevensoni]